MAFKCRYCGSKQAANDEKSRCIRCEIMYNAIAANCEAAEKIVNEIKKAEEKPRPFTSTNSFKSVVV